VGCASSASDLVEQVVGHLGAGDVQHQLVARGEQRPALQLQRPVGVGAEELAVGVDHLRLHPQAELHAQLVDMGEPGVAQTFGELGLGRATSRPAPRGRWWRPWNQPSSSTKRSTPTAAAAVGQFALTFSVRWSK
jgi:hypothetical protein